MFNGMKGKIVLTAFEIVGTVIAVVLFVLLLIASSRSAAISFGEVVGNMGDLGKVNPGPVVVFIAILQIFTLALALIKFHYPKTEDELKKEEFKTAQLDKIEEMLKKILEEKKKEESK